VVRPHGKEKSRKASEGGCSKSAGGHQLQSAMKLRLLSPVDSQREWYRERGDVKEGN
jgi:hypothetical protein